MTINSYWPRVSDLPKKEQEPFTQWLSGQTRPWIDGLAEEEQDGYYRWDYERWKSGKHIID